MSYTMPEFLAHAIAMEREAAERYLELADMMEAHNNLEVAALFRDMVRYSTMHGDSIVERAGKRELPKLQSWQYRWVAPTEVGDEEGFDYTMNAYQALEYARENEARGMNFYRTVAEKSADAEIKRLAMEFAAEEADHTSALDKMLAQTLRP
ncbi:ferritin-like domain-containing protein [Thauera chlorobenzoica]|uniref:Ferritin-like protein n=1 Tax=Thauera chlorobenzoica TaxID=96773 RepID=A0A1H5VGR4_9RHOO|nr:ferritin family protein [Thauera chlorobenzoica]APR05799.1 ferritin-like protein [Thauera chlorobenzoica]SEF86509.1 Rubrerythrin [Thauera chlorobenzoica]